MKIDRSDEEWRQTLDAQTYAICRCGGTEPPFSGDLLEEKRPGSFHCACCAAMLFDAADKYDSGSGWPSYVRPASEGAVAERQDDGHGMVRTEVLCARCDAHLGHVFPDGPPPTGLRYCINSRSLQFTPQPSDR